MLAPNPSRTLPLLLAIVTGVLSAATAGGDELRDKLKAITLADDDVARRDAIADADLALDALYGRFEGGERTNSMVTSLLTGAISIADDQTIPRMTRALPIAKEFGNAELEAWLLYSLGCRLTEGGDFERVEQVLLPRIERVESQSFDAWLRLVLADAQRSLGKYDDIPRWLDEAEALGARQAKSADLICQVRLDRCQYFLEIGLPEQAYAELSRAKAALSENVDPSTTHNLLRIDANLALATDDWNRVTKPSEDDPRIPHDSNIRGQLLLRFAIAQTELADLALDDKTRSIHLQPAIEALREARSCSELWERERTRADLLAARIDLIQGDGHSAGNRLDRIREEHAEFLSGPSLKGDGNSSAALLTRYHYLKSWSLVLTDAPIEEQRDGLAGLKRALDDQLEEWWSIPIRPGGVGYLHFDEKRLFLDQFIQGSLRVEPNQAGVETALTALVKTQAIGTLARSLQIGVPTLDEIRADLVTERRGALIFLPSIHRTWIFTLDTLHVDAWELPKAPRQLLEQDRDALVRELLDPTHPDGVSRVHAAADQLGSRLLPESVRRRMESWDECLIVGLDLLGWTPIECIPFGDSTFGEEIAVAHIGSLPAAIGLRRRALVHPIEQARYDVLSVAAPKHSAGDGFPTIELSATHRRLLSLDGSDHALLLSGASACRREMQQGIERGATFLNIVSHGVVDFQRERFAGILLAPSDADSDYDTLWCDAIHSPQPRIVLLSSCRALAAANRYGDDGASHLGGAYLSAGSDAVILSHIDIDLDASVELSSHLVRALRSGTNTAEALRLARREISRQSGWEHPFFHSTLQVHGWPMEPVFPATEPFVATSSHTPRRIAAILVLTLLAIAIGFIRKATLSGS